MYVHVYMILYYNRLNVSTSIPCPCTGMQGFSASLSSSSSIDDRLVYSRARSSLTLPLTAHLDTFSSTDVSTLREVKGDKKSPFKNRSMKLTCFFSHYNRKKRVYGLYL